MKLSHLTYILSIVFLAACSSNPSGDGEKGDETATADTTCTYEYQAAFTNLEWTAYKFTERAGVSGTFEDFEVTPGSASASSIPALLEGLKFSIQSSSVNSGNEDRDPKIVANFFGLMSSDVISGTLTNVQMDGNSGTGDVELVMNGTTQTVSSNLSIEGVKVTLETKINVSNWNAQSGIDSLNAVCEDLHTGSDGKSVLWPDVKVVVSSTLKANNCN